MREFLERFSPYSAFPQFFVDERIHMPQIFTGKVEEELGMFPSNFFSGCLTDPPYGLSFMGKSWDHGVPSADVWREVLRVLKPGAHMLAFGGTRTFHRLTCAIEDAGFEIRDCLMWLYGSGFPKSMDIGKAQKRGAFGGSAYAQDTWTLAQANKPLDLPITEPITKPATEDAKRWDGYGTSLKPAWEPIILAMKPTDGTFAANALKHGVAGLNIAAGRIETSGADREKHLAEWNRNQSRAADEGRNSRSGGLKQIDLSGYAKEGRWPANLLLDKSAAEALDAQSGELKSGVMAAGTQRRNTAGWAGPMPAQTGAATIGDSGGASRFFYVAKASTRERGEGNTHPTVKPIRLTTQLSQYLLTLICPPHQTKDEILLVPYCGSGSELIGALKAGWSEVVGIEMDAEYVEIAKRRLAVRCPS